MQSLKSPLTQPVQRASVSRHQSRTPFVCPVPSASSSDPRQQSACSASSSSSIQSRQSLVITRATKLGDSSLFGDSSSTSSLMGGASTVAVPEVVKPNLDNIPLESEVETDGVRCNPHPILNCGSCATPTASSRPCCRYTGFSSMVIAIFIPCR